MSRCILCGDANNLITHHISYEPEETVTLCFRCNSKVRKGNEDKFPELIKYIGKPKIGRWRKIIYNKNLIHIPKQLVNSVGRYVEIIEGGPFSFLVFREGLDYDCLIKEAEILLMKLKLYKKRADRKEE